MKSSKIIEKKSKLLSLFLKNFNFKINKFYFKKLSDVMFAIAEKIVIKMEKLLPLYVKYYEDIVDKEIAMANISSSDKVLHMGCGSVPSTSILIAEKTVANVVGIDRNSRSVEEARSCVYLVRSDDRIQIKHAEVLNFPVENFDVIIASQGIEPQDKILNYISQSMKNDARVIFRTISSVKGEITQHNILLEQLFKIGKMAYHENHGLLISVMLFKK
jgi:2-polyprenyl-3-methyl-5-hydroxy-6-metoxy-1,4-benzoquinol methylase